jgi:hypothetical protein
MSDYDYFDPTNTRLESSNDRTDSKVEQVIPTSTCIGIRYIPMMLKSVKKHSGDVVLDKNKIFIKK